MKANLAKRKPTIFDLVEPFKESLSVVRKDEESWFVNHEGRRVFDTSYEWAVSFQCGFASVTIDHIRRLHIDHTGRFVIKPQFSSAGSFFEDLALIAVKIVIQY